MYNQAYVIKAGNEMALALMELDTMLRLGVEIKGELSLSIMEMINLAIDGWREATVPEEV